MPEFGLVPVTISSQNLTPRSFGYFAECFQIVGLVPALGPGNNGKSERLCLFCGGKKSPYPHRINGYRLFTKYMLFCFHRCAEMLCTEIRRCGKNNQVAIR